MYLKILKLFETIMPRIKNVIDTYIFYRNISNSYINKEEL